MQIKRFQASDMRAALREVRDALGPDAVIMSSYRIAEGVEVVAAIDFDETAIRQQSQPFQPLTTANSLKRAPLIHDQGLDELKSEISLLKDFVSKHIHLSEWDRLANAQPVHAKLLKSLLSIGFHESLSRETASAANDVDYRTAWSSAHSYIQNKVITAESELIDGDGVVALIGPTGVGKTTTIAKLAARYVLKYGAESLGLITTDSYRIGAHEQLATYGKLLGVSVLTVDSAQTLASSLIVLKDKRLVLIDTAGLSQRDSRISEQLQIFSDVVRNIKFCLVLSSANQPLVVQETIENYSFKKIHSCILTKTDETTNLSEVLSYLISHRLPISYITNGQRVPEDIYSADSGALVEQAFELGDRYKSRNREIILKEIFDTGVTHVIE